MAQTKRILLAQKGLAGKSGLTQRLDRIRIAQRLEGNRMYLNKGVIAGIVPIYPQGTNSTMFTECCEVAICSDEPYCPSCGREVIGYDFPAGERAKARWRNATAHWRR